MLFTWVTTFANNWNSENTTVNMPSVHCIWLPWCKDTQLWSPEPASVSENNNITIEFLWNIITEMIYFAVVLWMIWVIWSWLFMVFSAWEDERFTKAKKYFTWSLAGTLLATTAIIIISILDKISISTT